jgi:uncharacterized coiled-coil DUF342 family protein
MWACQTSGHVRIVEPDMKVNPVAIALAVACLLLAGGIYYRHTVAVNEKQQDVALIQDFSNRWTVTKAKLDEHVAVILTLERDLDTRSKEALTYSNRLGSVSANLGKVQTEAKAAADAAKAEMVKRDARIAELEAERDDLSKSMASLNSSITTLEQQIADTRSKLDASEGDREFLLAELKRLHSEKAELERQFNDIALLRDQVRRLRDDLSVSRRLDWIRRGLYGNVFKGGEKLQRGFAPTVPAPVPSFDLDVELDREGGIRVAPPQTRVETNVDAR